MKFLTLILFLYKLFYKSYNSPMKLLGFTMVFNLIIGYQVLNISNILILFLEVWVVLSLILNKFILKEGGSSFYFGVVFFMALVLNLSFLLEGFEALILIFIVLTLKILMINIMILIMGEDMKMEKLSVILYILNSKSLLFFYGILFQKFSNKMLFYNLISQDLICFLMVLIWGFLMCISMILLIKKNLVGYLISSLNTSSYLILMICFLNLKLFFMGFFVDVVLFILGVYYMCNSKMNFMKNSNSLTEGIKYLFLFLFSLNVAGIPPFPSFFLELNIIFFMFSFLNSIFKGLFLTVVYFMLVILFCLLFNYLGSLGGNNLKDFSSEPFMALGVFLGIFMILMFQFFILYGN